MSEAAATVCEPPLSPSSRTIRIGVVAVTFFLFLLNAAVAALYALWYVANDCSAARSEASHGFDPTMLLPHGGLFWIVANATLILLIAFDAVWVTFAIVAVRTR
jgi:hypothetical protein